MAASLILFGIVTCNLVNAVTAVTLTPPTTVASGCPISDTERLEVGERRQIGCNIYECSESGLATLVIDCFFVLCADSIPTQCCPVCPNGPNCRLPNGEILPATEKRFVGDQLCRCPNSTDYPLPEPQAYHTAICEDVLCPPGYRKKGYNKRCKLQGK